MRSLDNQSEYWNRVATARQFTHPLCMSRFTSLVDPQDSILDVGCGYGRTCDELYQIGFRNVVGIDSSARMIDRGRALFPYLRLEKLEASHLPFENEVFNAVILFALLTCVPTNQGQKALVHEAFRVLRPNGIIYLSDYWLQADGRNLKRYDEFKDKYGIYGVFDLPDGAVVRHHEKRWISYLLMNFMTIELTDIHLTTMNGNPSLGFQYIGRKQKNAIDIIHL